MANHSELEPCLKEKWDLFHPRDPIEITQQIKVLVDLGFEVARLTRYQYKIGPHSFYPGKGTIVTDPCDRHRERGLEALLEVLKAETRAARFQR